jgi:hypothetical protein
LELPYGYLSFEQAARQLMIEREQARSAYRNAEVLLRASLDAGSRCMFAAALAWVEEIVSICESALAEQLPWDQAAVAIYSMRSVDLSQMLEEMRRQTSRAALHKLEALNLRATYVGVMAGTAPPERDDTGQTQAEPAAHANRPRATINMRMLETMQANQEAMGWNSTQWARHLQCAKSSVVTTNAWRALTMARERARAERARDRRRRPRPRRSD